MNASDFYRGMLFELEKTATSYIAPQKKKTPLWRNPALWGTVGLGSLGALGYLNRDKLTSVFRKAPTSTPSVSPSPEIPSTPSAEAEIPNDNKYLENITGRLMQPANMGMLDSESATTQSGMANALGKAYTADMAVTLPAMAAAGGVGLTDRIFGSSLMKSNLGRGAKWLAGATSKPFATYKGLSSLKNVPALGKLSPSGMLMASPNIIDNRTDDYIADYYLKALGKDPENSPIGKPVAKWVHDAAATMTTAHPAGRIGNLAVLAGKGLANYPFSHQLGRMDRIDKLTNVAGDLYKGMRSADPTEAMQATQAAKAFLADKAVQDLWVKPTLNPGKSSKFMLSNFTTSNPAIHTLSPASWAWNKYMGNNKPQATGTESLEVVLNRISKILEQDPTIQGQ